MIHLSRLIARKRRQLDARSRLRALGVVAGLVVTAAAFIVAQKVQGGLPAAARLVLEGQAPAVVQALFSDMPNLIELARRAIRDNALDIAVPCLTVPTGLVLWMWQVRHQKITLLLAQMLTEEGESDAAVRVLLTNMLDGDPGNAGPPDPSAGKTT